MTFDEMMAQCNKVKKVTPFEGRLLALDPGETLGHSTFEVIGGKVKLVDLGQEVTWPIKEAIINISALIDRTKPTAIVHEKYRVYGHRVQEHTGSELPTARVIGVIETLAMQNDLELFGQTAGQAKGFCTDEKLKVWGYYQKSRGEKHARDSIRHGTFFLLFGPKATK